MAITTQSLASKIKANLIVAFPVPNDSKPVQSTLMESLANAIAEAVVTEITTNATVSGSCMCSQGSGSVEGVVE